MNTQDLKIYKALKALVLEEYLLTELKNIVSKYENTIDNGNSNSGHYGHSNIKGRRGGSLPKGFNENFPTEIEKVLEKAKSSDNTNEIALIGSVQNKLIKEAANQGFDIDGYRHNIDVYSVRHSLNEHSNIDKEAPRGQIALTDNDIRKAAEYVYTYDKSEFGEKNDQGRDIIKLWKYTDDGYVLYIEEIRTKRKTLTLNAMRKYKNKIGNSNTLAGVTRHVWSTDNYIINHL